MEDKMLKIKENEQQIPSLSVINLNTHELNSN
jgi:hypothetical protein